jgi:hypothetical protein
MGSLWSKIDAEKIKQKKGDGEKLKKDALLRSKLDGAEPAYLPLSDPEDSDEEAASSYSSTSPLPSACFSLPASAGFSPPSSGCFSPARSPCFSPDWSTMPTRSSSPPQTKFPFSPPSASIPNPGQSEVTSQFTVNVPIALHDGTVIGTQLLQIVQERGDSESGAFEVASMASKAHQNFEDRLTADDEGCKDRESCRKALLNKAIDVVHALPASEMTPEKPTKIPLYIACDDMESCSREKLSAFDKEKLLDLTMMYGELVDGRTKKKSKQTHRNSDTKTTGGEVAVNPVQRAADLLKIGHAQIDRLGHYNHKNKVVVKSTGLDTLRGYCEVEVLDFQGQPNGRAFYFTSCHLRPLIDYSWKNDMTERISQLEKENAKLAEENVSLQRKVGTGREVQVVQLKKTYDPKKATKKIRSNGPDQRLSAADGNGQWRNDRPENKQPYQCQFCNKKYKTSGSLSSHRYLYHGAADKTEAMAKCKDCQLDFPKNNFKKHNCTKVPKGPFVD